MTTRMRLVSAVAIALIGGTALTPGAAARPMPKTIPFEETAGFEHLEQTGAWGDSHQKLLAQRAERQPLRRSVQPVDVGEIAVIPDNGRIFSEPRPESRFDLPPGAGIRFSPVANGFELTRLDAALEPSAGELLPLGDDDSREIALPFAFPFLGRTYTSVHVNSDGNVTLRQADTSLDPRDAARLVGGPPRIAPLLRDLNPAAGGAVRVAVEPDRMVVTWERVPTFGTTRVSTVQSILTRAGEVTLAYGAVDEPFGVAGVAEGGDALPFTELDLSADLPTRARGGAIFEEFAPAITAPERRLIAFNAALEFYATHPDHYDYLVVFTEQPQQLAGGAFAQHTSVRNATRGLGRPVFDTGFPARELESILNMNQIGLYWPDAGKLENPPIRKFRFAPGATSPLGPPGRDGTSSRARWFGTAPQGGAFTMGLHSGMSLLAHEVGHRWLAYARHRDPVSGQTSDLLLDDEGPGQHWNFFHDTRAPAEQFGGDPRASAMEGNAIADLGLGRAPCAVPGHSPFVTEPDELHDGYSQLDQYLMGLRPASEVAPFFYVEDPRLADTGISIFFGRSFLAESALPLCGRRVDVTVDDIRAVEGRRVPEFGDEDDMGTGRDVKTMAFVLVVDDESQRADAHAAAIAQVDAVRRAWERYFPKATGGRGRFDTRLRPPVH